MATTAAEKHWSHLNYLSELLCGEVAGLEDRRVSVIKPNNGMLI
jgi:hypothetical protein